MSWLDLFRVEAEKRNAETAVVIRDALAAEEVRKAEEAVRKADEEKAAKEDKEAQRTIRRKIRQSDWKDANREHVREYQRMYRIDHPPVGPTAEYRRKWSAAHPGKNAEYQRRYRAKMKALRIAKGEKK